MPREYQREYQLDTFEECPLFQSPASLAPPSCISDPLSAKVAARSEGAKTEVVQSTARCLITLLYREEGLTDFEIVEAYRLNYPESVQAKGLTGFVRMVTRSWCLLKPNDDLRNKKHENLNLIQRTAATRINPHSGRPNVVFNFIHPPTPAQIAEWASLAQGGAE